MLVRYCAPTLAGIKTGSMFSCPFADKDSLRTYIRRVNHSFCGKGLRAVPLKFQKGRALIYVYRPSYLERDLKQNGANRILANLGYGTEHANKCVAFLRTRMRENGEFPHEIGLFLGYPPEDVWGFIENKAVNYKYCGLWKVYGDAERAKHTFLRYKRCTDSYCAMLKKGDGLDRLAVYG